MTVLPRLGDTTSAKSETNRMLAYHRGRRRFDHDEAYLEYMSGTNMVDLARRYGVHRSSVEQAIRNVHNKIGVARSPQQPPPVADPPPCAANGVGNDSKPAGTGVVEAGGLRGAPAGTVHPPAREGKEQILVEVGAPIVRRQLDEHGDTVYVFDLPAARYVTHAWSLVQEMLAPFDPAAVRWINEED